MPEARSSRWGSVAAIGLLAAAVAGTFADVLFVAGAPVLSAAEADLWREFIFWREFGFGELSAGNLALWNPYVYCGIPFFGGFQSALLYPPNWLHLVAPLVPAINWGIALHFFLAGVFTYLWGGHRGLSRPARTLAAILFVFCGPYYLHLYAGHIMLIAPVAWAPLVMLSVDKLFDDRRPARWALVGMTAVSMQILAGHPQTVYYTAVAATLFAVARAIGERRVLRSDRRFALGTGLGFAGIFLGAAGLTAVQLFTGIDAASESVRGAGVPYEFAASFSFPPENFLTLLVPGFFGDLLHQRYWGRCYLWETCAFFGITGMWLAVYGVWRGDKRARRSLGTMAAICLLLALGSRTPLFDVLYRMVPGWDKFRGNAKFIILFALFATMLSGAGLDALLARRSDKRRGAKSVTLLAGASLLTCAALFIGSALVRGHGEPSERTSAWSEYMSGALRSGESFLDPRAYKDAGFVAEAARFASRGLLIAGATAGLCGALLLVTGRRRGAAYAVAALAAVEVLMFARSERATFELDTTRLPQEIQSYPAQNKGDGRMLSPGGRFDNQGMIYGLANVWGDDPGVGLRYAEFMTYLQGGDPDQASQYVEFTDYDPLMRMLRAEYLMLDAQTPEARFPLLLTAGGLRLYSLPEPLPKALLIEDFDVISDRDAIFAAMREPGFDARRKVILERHPGVDAHPGVGDDSPGRIAVTELSTDERLIDAHLNRPAVLLLTDAYHTGWRAIAETGSAQGAYQIIPANYVLQGIPLEAGSHHFRLEYLPTWFRVGMWVSIVSVVAYVIGWALVLRRGRNHA